MKTVFANRASNVLYDFLVSNHTDLPFLLPANVCPCVPETFAKADQRFEFIDIDETHAMDKKLCLDRLSPHDCSGVLFVHAYGHSFDNKDFYAQLRQYQEDVIIIDDRCLLVPSFEEQDINADLTLYSTGYAKYVELGYGGWGMVDARCNYSTYLPESEYLQRDETAYQTETISKVPDIRMHKQLINTIYNKELGSNLQVKIWTDYSDWRYMISVPEDKREAVLKSIFNHGYFAGTNYPSQAMNFKQQACPVAEREALNVINLFNDFRANEAFALGVCNAIKEVLS